VSIEEHDWYPQEDNLRMRRPATLSNERTVVVQDDYDIWVRLRLVEDIGINKEH
jgi:hypothetical protein